MRRGAHTLALTIVAGVGAALAALPAHPLVVYNPSTSVQRGFYVRAGGTLVQGDYVTVRAASVAPVYAALREFNGPSDRFIKRVAAVFGQRVCARDSTILLDGREVAVRLSRDQSGRPLPTWSGCHTLSASEVLLLGDTPDSFDGRYWGPTQIALIDGSWRLLLPVG